MTFTAIRDKVYRFIVNHDGDVTRLACIVYISNICPKLTVSEAIKIVRDCFKAYADFSKEDENNVSDYN